MADFEERTSIRGIRCHRCNHFVKKGRTYWRRSWQGYQREEYENYCADCMLKYLPEHRAEIEREISSAQKQIETLGDIRERILKSKKQYEEEKELCKVCKYRLRNLTGECDIETCKGYLEV